MGQQVKSANEEEGGMSQKATDGVSLVPHRSLAVAKNHPHSPGGGGRGRREGAQSEQTVRHRSHCELLTG